GTLSKTQIEGLKNIVNTFTYTNDVLNFIKKQASKKRVYEDFFKALELKIMDLKKRIKKHELLAEVSINKKDYELVEMTLIRELILHLVAENIYRESY
ncbi:MAG TPA: hypothetical protein DCK87_01345, partial [Desulfotomaculum sp.]|nr:hypothetical protein [Desulfotomaculum sp.]